MRPFLGLWAAVLSLLLCGASAAVASPGDTHVVTARSAELRAEPADEATLAMTLEPGRRLKELQRRGAWIKVLVYGEIGLDGWILQSSVGPEDRPDVGNASPQDTDGASRDDGSKARTARYMLTVEGRTQPFRVGCTIVGARGNSRTWKYEGRAPSRLHLDGRALRCRVDKLDQHAGLLSVSLYERGGRLPLAQNRTQSAFGCVRLRSNGPWGNAYARRCSRIAIFRNSQTTGAP
jgi:hypothetical protein